MDAPLEAFLLILAAAAVGAVIAAILGWIIAPAAGHRRQAERPSQTRDVETRPFRWEPWAAYIDREVQQLCDASGWGYQVHRRSAVEQAPEPRSPLDGFSWRLIPDPESMPEEFGDQACPRGVYYVLRFDHRDGRFILQHDTRHGGDPGSSWHISTCSAIDLIGAFGKTPRDGGEAWQLDEPAYSADQLPPSGWLRDCLAELTSRCKPNEFA